MFLINNWVFPKVKPQQQLDKEKQARIKKQLEIQEEREKIHKRQEELRKQREQEFIQIQQGKTVVSFAIKNAVFCVALSACLIGN